MIFTQLASDNFNRADASSLGANWQTDAVNTVIAPISIASNLAVPSSATGTSAEVYIGTSFPAGGQYSAITIANPGGGTPGTSQIWVPMVYDQGNPSALTQNVYQWRLNGPAGTAQTSTLRKVINGNVIVTLGTVSITPNYGDIFLLAVLSGKLYCYQNGTLKLGPIADSTFTSGKPGMEFSITGLDTAASLWAGGSVTAGTPNQLMLMGVGT